MGAQRGDGVTVDTNRSVLVAWSINRPLRLVDFLDSFNADWIYSEFTGRTPWPT